MATEADHFKKAESNKRFLSKIDDEFCDWIAIVAFYAAVHFVEALLAKNGMPSNSHRERNSSLRQNYPSIWEHFQPLYNVSKWLRYTNCELSATHIKTHLVDGRLADVESAVRTALKK